MKRILHVLGFISAMIALFGFCECLIVVFRATEMSGSSRVVIAIISLVGFVTSLAMIGYFLRVNVVTKKEEDETSKNLKREADYAEWQRILAESESDIGANE